MTRVGRTSSYNYQNSVVFSLNGATSRFHGFKPFAWMAAFGLIGGIKSFTFLVSPAIQVSDQGTIGTGLDLLSEK